MGAAIGVHDIHKSYGGLRAVDGVSFDVGEGEFFGILGPNGAGKTTTLEIVEGLRGPDSGEVTVLGMKPWPRNPALLPRMGVQLQASSFFERLTAREQLQTFAALYGVSPQRADEMLEVVGLTAMAGVVNQVFSSVVAQANIAATGRPATYQLTASQVEDKSLKAIQYLAPGLLGWAIASGGAFAAATTLVGWRENKLLRRLRLAPVSTTSVVAARIGVSVAIGIVQMFVFLLIATTPYYGLKLTPGWWMAIPVIICGTLAFMSIGLLVGSVAKTQQAATSIANLIILPMAFLGGAFVPLEFAPQWLRDVSYAMPLRYLVTGMQDVMARGLGAASALPAIGILLAFTAVLTMISVRVFRWDEI